MATRVFRRRVATGIVATALLHALPQMARADDLTLPLRFVTAKENGQPVQDAAWREAELAEVERLYGPLGVRFRAVEIRDLRLAPSRVETRHDRDSFARECADHVINVFVVASLRDVDDGVTMRRGVHWRASSSPPRRYLIVSAIAGATVLAHELGHYFGNHHSPVVDNVMSYERSGAAVFFDEAQRARIRASAREVLRSGELSAVVARPPR